ncbi:MAG: formylglycine-generating enzyme family protein [Armatimonadota bacterium]|nr:formylglycine-generating enzyme family protein [Armatimonadota bacterium]
MPRSRTRESRRGWLAGGVLVAALAAAWVGWSAPAPPPVVMTKSGVPMVRLPGGTFVMGDKQGAPDETPHRVTLSPFLIDQHEVTQEEFERVMGENPSRWRGKNNPVEQVRFSTAAKYCNARSLREGLTPCYDTKTWRCNFDADGYRLPTEAEWEYAARAGTSTPYFFGASAAPLREYAWTKENSGGRPRPVAQKRPNPWGLYDIYGNVWEWCNDFYEVDYYTKSPEKDPRGPAAGVKKVVRGGAWNSRPAQCRSSYRYNENPAYEDVCFGYDVYGLRCVRSLK